MTEPEPDPRVGVERAMEGLESLADLPTAAHVEAFERVHVALGEALAAGAADPG